MVVKAEDNKLLFIKCKKSVLEIVGWKSFIFLPQNFVWRFFIIFTVMLSIMLNFTCCSYKTDKNIVEYIRLSCDIAYFVDTVLSTLHYAMKKTRKLRYGKKRHFLLLLLDYLSLLPFTIIFGHSNYKRDSQDPHFTCYLHLCEFVRIYQVPKSFCNIKHFIYKVKTYIIVTFFEVFSYLLLLTYTSSCCLALQMDEEQKERCNANIFPCIFSNFSVTFCVFSQLFIPPFQDYYVKKKKPMFVTLYLVGYLFTYAYLLPLALYMSYKYLVKVFKSSLKWIHLKVLLNNMIEDKKLKKRILKQLHYTVMYGKGNEWPEILNIVPLCLRKSIFCDMHWEAMRHSKLLKDLSMSCKRSLALYMTTEFIIPETTLIRKSEKNAYFIYIESGMLQIMSSENNESPVLNFSSGSVLGEISFFLQTESKVTLRVAKLSAVHLLHFKDFFRVLMDYPDDMREIYQKFQTRLEFAKSIYKNKTEIKSHFSHEEDSYGHSNLMKEDNIKWLKEQYRALTELKQAEKLINTNFNPESKLNYERKFKKLKTQLEHTSVYLPHICIDDTNLNKLDNVCLKVSFPWMLNPQSHFFRVWNRIVFVFVILTVGLYPAILGWFEELPDWFFNISVVVSVINITDVVLQLITGVQFKNVIISDFSSAFTFKLNKPAFWTDVIAALPFQFLLTDYERNHAFGWNLYFLNVLLKSYRMFSIMNKWTYRSRPGAFFRVCLKYLLYFLIFLVWSATTFNYIIMDWAIYEGTEWYDKLEQTREISLPIESSLIKALFTVLKIPGGDVENEVLELFFFSSFFSNFFHFFFIVMLSESISAYVIDFTYELEYKREMKFVSDFMEHNHLFGRLQNRVIKMMWFQLNYEKGCKIIRLNYITDNVVIELKKEILRKTMLPTVMNCKLFELEDETFQMELCKKGVLLVLPKHSVLLTFGVKPMSLFLIQKGFVQINSFISKDMYMNISTPIVMKEGDAFPVIDALSQNPSAVSAIAITDCQVLRFDLEDILSIMIIHGMLKDLVDAVKATNLSALSSAKLGVSVIKDDLSFEKEHHRVVFKRLKFLSIALNYFLRKKTINSHNKWYIRWEFIRFLLLLFNLFSWPVLFGFSAESESVLVPIRILFLIDCISWVDFYIRLHTAYYNKIGICVTHPLYTSFHYLTSSFIMDFIVYAPNFQIMWWFSTGHYAITWNVVMMHLLMRSVSLYRITGFLSYFNEKKNLYNIKLVKIFLYITVIVHYYVNVQLYNFFKRTLDFPEEEKNFNEFFKYYLTEVGQVFSMILKNVHHFEDFKIIDLLLSIMFALLGYFLRIYIYGNITLVSVTSEKKLNFYQYYMKSFVEYLTSERASKSILSVIAEYYKNDWDMYEGYDSREIFSHFPRSLHEDITYSMYKGTFNAIGCFSKANESFLRILSRSVQEIILQKGSVVIYKNQVQSDIFFIRKGICFVENNSKILYKGSIIGDFQRSRKMKNTISAKTSLQLLKMSSEEFFLAINNFHYTRMAFQAEAAEGENYIASIYIEEEDHFADHTVQEDFDDKSKFVPVNLKQSYQESVSLSKKQFILNPESFAAYILDYISLFVVYTTLFLIPTFIVFRIFSASFICIIYLLDFAWIIKILLIMRTAYYNEKGGFYVYDKLAIRHRYMRLYDGFVTHLLSVIPFELLPLVSFRFDITDKCCSVMSFFYINRLLRGTFLLTSKKQDRTKLLTNFLKGLVKVLITKFIFINFCVSFHMLLKDYGNNVFNRCYYNLQNAHMESMLDSYHWVLNINVDHHSESHQSDAYIQSLLRLILSVCSFMSKVFLLNEVLMIMFVKYQIKSDEMLKLEHLEDFLLVRDVSPILFKRTKEYFCNLLYSYHESAEPFYLRCSPTIIKGKIMQKFYAHHFSRCYPFKDIDYIFIKQLAARLERFIFFPGDYITEKGDVDHNMYFIHKGEIYCIKKDKNIRDLEEPVDLYVTGENFGVLQGILPIYPHTNTYRAKTKSDVLVLNYYKWKDLREAFPDITEVIYKKSNEYKINLENSHQVKEGLAEPN